MRRDPALFRAAHLHVYFGFLRNVGAPVSRELARSRLPTWIEDTPDEYISLPLALDWLASCGRDFPVMELGFRASDGVCAATMGSIMRRRLAEAQTGFAGVDVLVRTILAEDSILRSSMRVSDDAVRVIVDSAGLEHHPLLSIVEWQNIRGILISAGAGPAGPAPREITFVSRHAPPEPVLERWPAARILVGQPHTSVLFDREHLALPRAHARGRERSCRDRPAPENRAEGWTFAELLRALVRPYLRDGYPDLATVADVTGMSRRTLQRRLQDDGRSYSQIVQEARFDLARDLLCDPSLRVIDVAMLCSYENPQHFSRAFRKIAGVTPRQYRGMMAAGLEPRMAPNGAPTAGTA